MGERWYVVKVIITSSGSEDRSLTPYDDYDVALRKFHEAFNVIGGGPKKICATILDQWMNQDRVETWTEPQPEPEPTPEPEGE